MATKKDAGKEEFRSPTKFKFSEGEKVLCYHGPLIYEAKCQATRLDEKTKVPEYHMHYSGWNKSWDEWVPESRVLKFNDANLQKKEELRKAQKSEKNKKKKKKSAVAQESSGPESRSSTPVNDKEKEKEKEVIEKEKKASGNDKEKKTNGGDKEKKGNGNGTEKEKKAAVVTTPSTLVTSTSTSSLESFASEANKKKRSRSDSNAESDVVEQPAPKIEVKIKIPDDLKPWLVDDWELISRQRKLFNLPATKTVDEILDEYYNYKVASKANNPSKEYAVLETVKGIKDYFNVMLGTQLLYKFERAQYAKILVSHPDTQMSKIYGAIHLLRLFVKMGGLMEQTDLDEKTIQLLLSQIQDFLKYLSKNAATLFSLQEYGSSSCDYQRRMLNGPLEPQNAVYKNGNLVWPGSL